MSILFRTTDEKVKCLCLHLWWILCQSNGRMWAWESAVSVLVPVPLPTLPSLLGRHNKPFAEPNRQTCMMQQLDMRKKERKGVREVRLGYVRHQKKKQWGNEALFFVTLRLLAQARAVSARTGRYGYDGGGRGGRVHVADRVLIFFLAVWKYIDDKIRWW